VDVDEDFREHFASKVLSVTPNTRLELFTDDDAPSRQEAARKGFWVKIAYPHRNFGPRIPNLITALCCEGVFPCNTRLSATHVKTSGRRVD
jgi:ribulose-bisphosphate carboxylase large chain